MSRLDKETAEPLGKDQEKALLNTSSSGNIQEEDEDELERRSLTRSPSSVQGSLANLLPVLDEDQNDSGAVLRGTSGEGTGDELDDNQRLLNARTLSERSFDLDSDLDDVVDVEYSEMKDQGIRTPGEIRTAVLEWMYEEKDDDPCPDLCLSNSGILEDLISVFVTTVLHGKSDVIRAQVWRFLIQASCNSLHFAFLLICNLNASCHQSDSIQEDAQSVEYKRKRQKDLEAIEKVIEALKTNSIPKLEALGNPDAPASSSSSSSSSAAAAGGDDGNDQGKKTKKIMSPQESQTLTELKATLTDALGNLEQVHDNQVLTNLDLNARGRTARQNVDLLVQKVRNALIRDKTSQGEEMLKTLDGKIGFIKTLTDLDDWLIRSVERGERIQVLKEKLETLSVALPLGAYFPTAVDRATQKHRVLRLVVEETIVFNTARKCPFLLVAEVEPISDGGGVSTPHGNMPKDAKSPRKIALEALEMVSTRDFWKNPIKEIKQFKERATSEVELTMHIDTEDEDANNNGTKTGFKKVDQESWEDMQQRIRRESPYGDRPRWQLASMFVKAGDDLRQQQLGLMFVSTFQKIFLEERVDCWVSPYKVIATGPTCGLLEPARNSDSIARIKERGNYSGIDQYFRDKFGPTSSRAYKRAQKNFLQSLAGYSIISYIIKWHDRHNGNVLLDTEGHLLHIDCGFLLGFSHKLERSPFKLTPDMIEILGGPYSPTFQKFRTLMERAYIAANKHHREIVLLAELMAPSGSACFADGRRWVIEELQDRLCINATKKQLRRHINDIIDQSMGNVTTRCYDAWQRCFNKIH